MSNFCDTCLLFWAMEIGNRLVGVPLLQNLNLDSTIPLLSIRLRILFSKLFIKLVSINPKVYFMLWFIIDLIIKSFVAQEFAPKCRQQEIQDFFFVWNLSGFLIWVEFCLHMLKAALHFYKHTLKKALTQKLCLFILYHW